MVNINEVFDVWPEFWNGSDNIKGAVNMEEVRQ